MTASRWIPAFPLSELEVGAARVFRHDGRQIAVFRPRADELFAVDNHCPHEGYPLAQGGVRDGVLTCAWHNFKFRLRDGACLKGDEDVRTWPVRLQEDTVAIDVADPDPRRHVPRFKKSLEEGLLDRQMGRVARDLARLLSAGESPAALALAAADYDARRAEYGTTHALPVAVDALHLCDRRSDLECVHPLLVAFSQAAEPNVRRPERPRPEPIPPGADRAATAARFAELVEAEEAAEAEALLRGAIAAGWEPAEVEALLWEPCCEHFLSFGHPVIYLTKTCVLLERAGWEAADSLLGALAFRITSSTREDVLPPWAALRERLAGLEADLPRLFSGSRKDPPAGWRPDPLVEAVLDGSGAEMFAALSGELEAGVPPEPLALALVAAAAERMLRFDVAIDSDPTVQDGWLFVTHPFTFASAVRTALGRHRHPRVLRLLFFAARFVHGARALDLPAERRAPGPAAPISTAPAADVAAVERAIAAGEAGAAVAAAQAVTTEGGLAALADRLEELSTPDGLARPIVLSHALKTGLAASREARALAAVPALKERADRPLMAFARLLASPIHERSLVGTSHEAVELVAHGRIPKLLSS